jgi:hypothetical protein
MSGRGGAISVFMSTKAEYKERQAAVQKFNVCSTFVDRPSRPLERTKRKNGPLTSLGFSQQVPHLGIADSN